MLLTILDKFFPSKDNILPLTNNDIYPKIEEVKIESDYESLSMYFYHKILGNINFIDNDIFKGYIENSKYIIKIIRCDKNNKKLIIEYFPHP